MSSKTFILGAGFSALAGFPLIRDLGPDVIRYIESKRHPLWEQQITPQTRRYEKGEFYAGRSAVDPTGLLGYEELLLQLLRRVKFADSTDACFSTLRILHQASGSLLWCKQRLLSTLPPSYLNFATWVNESHGIGQRNAIVSLNWDLLAERALSEMRVPWTYGLQSPVPFLKPHGSINWISYLKHGLQSTCWQQIPHTMFSWRPELPFEDPDADLVNPDLQLMVFPGESEDEESVAQIWEEAAQVIREREEVVFIGYSLPTYDAPAREFFRRSTEGKAVEVYTRSVDVLETYRKFLSGANIVTTKPISFEDCPYALRLCK